MGMKDIHPSKVTGYKLTDLPKEGIKGSVPSRYQIRYDKRWQRVFHNPIDGLHIVKAGAKLGLDKGTSGLLVVMTQWKR